MAKARWPEKLELEVLGFESSIEQKFLREIRVPKLIVRNENKLISNLAFYRRPIDITLKEIKPKWYQ